MNELNEHERDLLIVQNVKKQQTKRAIRNSIIVLAVLVFAFAAGYAYSSVLVNNADIDKDNKIIEQASSTITNIQDSQYNRNTSDDTSNKTSIDNTKSNLIQDFAKTFFTYSSQSVDDKTWRSQWMQYCSQNISDKSIVNLLYFRSTPEWETQITRTDDYDSKLVSLDEIIFDEDDSNVCYVKMKINRPDLEWYDINSPQMKNSTRTETYKIKLDDDLVCAVYKAK